MLLKELQEKLKNLTEEEKQNLPDWLKDETIELGNDTVQAHLLTNDEGKKLFQSMSDKRVTDGITTFKEKTMPGLIDEAVKKANPEETEEQKRIRKIEEDNEKFQAQLKKEKLTNAGLGILSEKKLGDFNGLVGRFIGDDEDTTKANLESFSETVNKYVETQVDAKVKELSKDHGRNPGGGDNNDAFKNDGNSFSYNSMNN